MIIGSRRGLLNHGDDRVLLYSTLFLASAFISAMGAGIVGALAFLPSAVAIELAAKFSRRTAQGNDHETVA